MNNPKKWSVMSCKLLFVFIKAAQILRKVKSIKKTEFMIHPVSTTVIYTCLLHACHMVAVVSTMCRTSSNFDAPCNVWWTWLVTEGCGGCAAGTGHLLFVYLKKSINIKSVTCHNQLKEKQIAANIVFVE